MTGLMVDATASKFTISLNVGVIALWLAGVADNFINPAPPDKPVGLNETISSLPVSGSNDPILFVFT
jgi:hypothetical protein